MLGTPLFKIILGVNSLMLGGLQIGLFAEDLNPNQSRLIPKLVLFLQGMHLVIEFSYLNLVWTRLFEI